MKTKVVRMAWLSLVLPAVALLSLLIWFLVGRHAPPPPIEYSEAALRLMLVGAQKRDPIACGQGLAYFEHHAGDPRRAQFVYWCCGDPPVDDMAGIVPAACRRALERP